MFSLHPVCIYSRKDEVDVTSHFLFTNCVDSGTFYIIVWNLKIKDVDM